MAKSETYSVTDFLILLKLGIWNRGYVKDWGFIEQVVISSDKLAKNECFIRKLPEEYLRGTYKPGRQIGIGLNLLDIYLSYLYVEGYRRISTYVIVISKKSPISLVEDNLIYLKISNRFSLSEFKELMFTRFSRYDQKKLWSPLGRIRQKNRYDSGVFSPHRKY